MEFIKRSFAMLFWRPVYAGAFYLTACALLSSGTICGTALGIPERTIIWGALALVLPLNVAFCGVWRLSSRCRHNLVPFLLRLALRKYKVSISQPAQRRVILTASYGALLVVVCIFGAVCSSITTAVFVQINQAGTAGGFPWVLYAKVIAIEDGFMLLLVSIPAIMRWIWLPLTVRKYEESVYEESRALLTTTAAAHGLILMSSVPPLANGAPRRRAVSVR